MRLQTMVLPASGYDFALIVDQVEEMDADFQAALADFGRCLGARATLVLPGTVEVV